MSLFGKQLLLLAFVSSAATAQPRVFRAVLPASARAPLPAAAQVMKVVPSADSVWYLARDCSASPCSAAVYQWSQAGVAQFAIAASGADTAEVRDLTLEANGLPLLVASQGVLELVGGQFAPSAGIGAGVRAVVSRSGSMWIVWRDDSVSFAPAWPLSGGEKRISLPGRIEAWAATRAGDLWLAAAAPGNTGSSLLYSVTRGGGVHLESTPESWKTGRIRSLFTDRMDNLWISLSDGSLIRNSGGAYDSYGAADGLPATPLAALEDDPAGNYYLLFAGGAMYGIPASSQALGRADFVRFEFPGVLTPLVGIALDTQNGVWITAGRGGAFRVQGTDDLNWLRGWSTSSTAAAARSAIPAVAPRGLVADAIGIAPAGRFSILNSSNGLAASQVSSIASDRLGNLYFTTGYAYGLTGDLPNTPGNGISRWDHRAFTTFNTSNSSGLPSNTVHASLYDSVNDVIWFGTDKGLARFNPNTAVFTSIAALAGVNVRDFRLDASGNLWVATLGSGVYKLRSADGAQLAQYTVASTSGQLTSNQVTSIAIDGLNQLWAGTYGGGLNKFNLSSSSWTPISDAYVSGDGSQIFDLETDASNNLWIGLPNHGLVRRSSLGVDSNFADPNQSPGNGLGRNRVYTIYRDGQNNLWFCFTFSGEIGHVAVTFLPASQVNSASPAFQSYNAATDGFPVDNVLSFGQESSTAMWFGSASGGAWRFGGPVDAPGWPQALTGYVVQSSPVLADLDGDGQLEIVVGDTAGFVYAFHADGSLMWKYNAQSAFPVGVSGSISIQSSPAVADVDGDGKPEVVIGLNGFALPPIPVGQGGVLILSNTGTLKRILYTYDISNGAGGKQDGYAEGVFATPVLANVDDDPEPEIMVGALDNLFYAWNADGSSIYSRDNDGDGKFDEDPPGDWTPWTPLDSTDDFPGWKGVDDDGNGEIDEGNSSDDDEDGMIDEDPAEWPFMVNDTTLSSAVVGDILHNGKPAIVFGTDFLGNGTTTRSGFLRAMDPQGNPLPGFPQKTEQVIWSSPVLVDLNGDGYWEIIHGSALDMSGSPSPLVGRLVYAWNRDGTSFLPGANGKFASTDGRSFASFAVGDIDNDGQPELVIATSSLRAADGTLLDASGNPTTNAIGQMLYVFRRDGSSMPGFPVQPYTVNPAANLVGSPILADVNGDGYLEILVPVAGGVIVVDRNGRGVPGMGLFENLQDVSYLGEMKSTPAVGDIDGDGILELVYALGVDNNSSGILHVVKLGPVTSTVQRSWPMGRRVPSRNAIFDVLVGDAQALEKSGTTTIIVQAFAGRAPIASVVADLSSFGGSATQQLYDDGAHGDRSVNDGYFAFQLPASSVPAGRFQIPITVTDTAGRSDAKTIFYLHAGTGKLLSVSKSAINFGTVGQGLNGEMHFSVANVGDQNVTITGMSSSDPEFYVAIPSSTPDSSPLIYRNFPSSGFPQTLAPGATLIVRLRLHPDFNPAGARSATLTIHSDDPTSRTIALTGTSRTVAGGIQLPATSVSFLPTAVGSTFDVYYNITSIGAEPLIVKSITFSNPEFYLYKLTNPPYPRSFDPGVVAPYIIRFRSSAVGAVSATMTITTNDPANPTLNVALNGTGTGGGAGCAYALGSLSAAPGAGAASASVTVTTPGGCPWAAWSGNISWLTITSGSSGSGSGSVSYSVAPNPGATLRTGTLLIAGQTFTVAQLGAIAPPALRFVPMTPCRVVDTRNAAGPFGGPSIGGGSSRDFNVPTSACGVPSTAQAYSLNVAVVPAGPLGYLTLWPTGQTQPLASTLNSLDGRIKSNAAIVPAGTGGSISVFGSNATDVILDINGYFVPASVTTALAFYPITPCRIADTRNATAPLGGPSLVGGSGRTFPILSSTCGLPAAAQAYSLNFAAVPPGPLGYVTAWPTGQAMPLAASLNAITGTVTANAAIVPAGTAGSINVFASNATDLVIDVNGYFAPMATGGLSLYGVTPCRVLDTRLPAGSPPITGLNVAVSASPCGIPTTAQADVLSVTVVPRGPLGYMTLWPQGQTMPVVSTLNALDGAVTSNLAIVPTASGSISIFPSNPTHVVMDISGYFGP